MIKASVKYGILLAAITVAGCSSTSEKPAPEAPAEKAESAPAVQPETAAKSLATPKSEPEQNVAQPTPVEAPKPVAKPATPTPLPAEPVAAKEPEPVKQHKIPSDPNRFLVVTEAKTSVHPQFGQGEREGFTVNGVQGKELVVERGKEYVFEVDTGVKHDFYLTTNPAGWGAATYSGGVEGQFTYSGEVTFTPNQATPDVLYYQCRNHKSMGGKIQVINPGETAKVTKAAPSQAASSASTATAGGGDERSANQKLSYAQMLLMGAKVKAIETSGDAKAKAQLSEAKQGVEEAKKLKASGDYAKATAMADASVRTLMMLSSGAAPASATQDNSAAKAEYDELTSALQNYEKSYEKNVKRAKSSNQALKATLNEAEYKSIVADAKSKAQSNDYAGANKLLHQAQQMITTTLTTMLQSQTVVYDKDFATPQEEYEYELARLESYEELIPIAIEQRQPSPSVQSLADTFVQKAKKIKGEGKEVVAKGDYKLGVMAMQAATDNLIRALRTLGVQ